MPDINDVFNLVNDLDKRSIKIQENHEVRINECEKDVNRLGNKVRGTGKMVILSTIILTAIITIFGFVKG